MATHEPRPRRTYSELPAKGLKDVDAAARAQLIHAAVISAAGGAIGYIIGLYMATKVQSPAMARMLPLVTALVLWLFVFTFAFALSRVAGWAAGAMSAPQGKGTRKREYSHAESLAANGLHQEAVTFFQLAAAENPTDTTPLLRAARIYRDSLHDHEAALRCFREAREVKGATESQWRAITHELIELLTGPLAQPVRAAPELARLAERAAGAPEGTWALAELAAVKKLIGPSQG